jgi:hypothetical protein
LPAAAVSCKHNAHAGEQAAAAAAPVRILLRCAVYIKQMRHHQQSNKANKHAAHLLQQLPFHAAVLLRCS